MYCVEPTFEIDDMGRALCQCHSNYAYFIAPGKSYFQERQLERLLTCKSCSHYFDNDCYFPKTEIDKIEYDRLRRNAFICKLCGNKIDRMFTVIQKLYLKEKYNVEIPLICCLCYESLNHNEYLEESKKWFYKFLYVVIGQSFFLFYFLISFLIFGPVSFLFLLFCIPWFLSTYKILKKLKNIKRGMRYYEKNFAKRKNGKIP
jgi:hypothetical protein